MGIGTERVATTSIVIIRTALLGTDAVWGVLHKLDGGALPLIITHNYILSQVRQRRILWFQEGNRS
jgi:hypothetical protein